jgi:Domain of unknown function (DUF5615)
VTLRLYIDEDAMDKDLVLALRARGVEVITALEASMIERHDEEHLEYATAQGRILYSFNVGDFCRLHTDFLAHGRSHAGLILARQQRYSVGEQMRRLLKLIAVKSLEDMKNQVEFLSAWD